MPTPRRWTEGNIGCTAIARCARIRRGQRPRAPTQAPGSGTARSYLRRQRQELQAVSGSQRTYADDNRHGKSDSSVIPRKAPNNAEGPAAEAMKGRELAKGNSPERNALRTQGRESTLPVLERVRQAATRDREQRLTALLHHIYDVERLRAAYLAIRKDAAAGVDGETWEQYGENLEANLEDLSHRLGRGAYRARPVRRVYILKVGKPGELRPLGVPALEDKIVQRATFEVLNAISHSANPCSRQ